MVQANIGNGLEAPAEEKVKFDLSGYFRRIGYDGGLDPSLGTLREIHRCHAQSIPFENLNPFLRIPIVLNIEALYEKLVLNNRGGYCFEHNLLLWEALKQIGFKVKGLAARVLWNVPEGVTTARGHMLLLVEINANQFVADVGFGGLTLTAPLMLKADVEQQTPHEYFKLTHASDHYTLHAKVQGAWKRVYTFSMQENFLVDYEVTSWYLSNHPTSHFVTGLIAALPFDKGRHTLRNDDFATHYLDGGHERKHFENVSDLKETLEKTFGISLPEGPSGDSYFQKLIQPSARKGS
jgi:N-hydroxyarylamine O-acetyltransferase